MAFAAMSCSCNGDKSFGIEYSLNSDGTTDGSVTVTFPYGEFSMKGDAGYQFEWTNVTKKLLSAGAMSLGDALKSNDAKVAQAAGTVNSWLESAVQVKDAGGHYDIFVKGYVKETLTGLTFSVDKHFSNKEE